MSFVLTLIFVMFSADTLWWVWAYRRLGPVVNARRWRVVLGVFMGAMVVLLLMLLGGRVIGQRMEILLPRPLLVGVYLWHFILLPMTMVWMVAGLIGSGIGRLRRTRATPEKIDTAATGISRRELLRTATAVVPPVATTLATGISFAQIGSFRVRRFDLPLKGLPAALSGMTIAQVSDVHVGQFTTDRILRKIVDSTNELRSDLVLLTGDLINYALSDLPGSLDAVKRLDSRSGIYMIQGNHDLMQGREEFDAMVRRAGVNLLVNETAMVSVRNQPVQLLGLQWGPGRDDAGVQQSMNSIVPMIQPGAFPILMAHHPHAFDPAALAGIPLTLAGHTHGGQIMPFGVGFGPMMYRYWSGLYEKGASKLIVSNGVGNWFPLRIGAPAEIVHITLRSA